MGTPYLISGISSPSGGPQPLSPMTQPLKRVLHGNALSWNHTHNQCAFGCNSSYHGNATEAWLGSSDLCTVLAACFPWYPGCLLDVAFHLSPDAEGSGPVVPEILKSALIPWRLGPHWQMQITGHFLEHCYTSPLAILDGSPQLYHAKLVQDRRTVGGEGLPGADGFSGE